MNSNFTFYKVFLHMNDSTIIERLVPLLEDKVNSEMIAIDNATYSTVWFEGPNGFAYPRSSIVKASAEKVKNG